MKHCIRIATKYLIREDSAMVCLHVVLFVNQGRALLLRAVHIRDWKFLRRRSAGGGAAWRPTSLPKHLKRFHQIHSELSTTPRKSNYEVRWRSPKVNQTVGVTPWLAGECLVSRPVTGTAACQCTSRRGAVWSPVRPPGVPGTRPWRRSLSKSVCLTEHLAKRSSATWDPGL